MASEKEITSTERLLDVIRSGSEQPEVSEEPKADSGAAKGSLFAGRFARQKGVVVGVEIGYSHIRFVRVSQETQKRWKLLDYAGVAIPEDLTRGTPKYADFLKDALGRYCGPPGKSELWAVMADDSVEIRNITVPSVSRKELENVVFWSAKKELAFNEHETVFDYEIQGSVVESGLEKLSVLFYAAPRKDVEDTKQLFDSAGYTLSGLTIAPLALQNIFRADWVPAREQTVASLHIGSGWSRIDIFSSGNLVLTRGIKAGINSMAESLADEYQTWRRQFSGQGLPGGTADGDGSLKLETPSEMELVKAERLVHALSPDSKPEPGLADEFGLDSDTVFRLITPALERLVRQVERTFEHYTVTMGREKINSVYLSASMNAYRPIVDYIGEQLDIECDLLDPMNPAHAWVDGVTERESISSRTTFISTLGVALSSPSRTLNLIYTQEDQKQKKKYVYANYAVLAIVGVLLMGCIGWYAWLDSTVTAKEMRVAELQRVIAEGVPATEENVRAMAEELRQDRRLASEIRDRYLPAAIFGAVSAETPEAIKLIDVRTDLGKALPGQRRADGTAVSRSMMIDGFVTGRADTLDADLIAYVMRIQSLPLFERVIINAKVPEMIDRREVLRFTLTASMEVPSS